MTSKNNVSVLFRKIILNAILFLPFIYVCFFVYKYGCTIPHWDQWELVPFLEKMHNHTLSFLDIWKCHSEHRIFFPRLTMLLLARISNWNIALELCTNLILASATFLFLLSLLRNTLKTVPFSLNLITSLIVFSLVQEGNWLWGWQIQIFMSVLGSVIAVWAADRWPGKNIGLNFVILGSVLSSYSFNSGLITWPVMFFFFLVHKNWKWKHLIILIAACAATVFLYYFNYTKPPEHPETTYLLKHPFTYIRYVLTYLGASLSWKPSMSFAVAIILLLIVFSALFNLLRLDRQKFYTLLPWFALVLYSCMAACATGIGRSGFGYEQAFTSRYTTISLYLPLSAAILFPYSIKFFKNLNNNYKYVFFIILTGLFLFVYLKSSALALKNAKLFSQRINSAKSSIQNPQLTTDFALRKVFPKPDVARKRLNTLTRIGIKFKSK